MLGMPSNKNPNYTGPCHTCGVTFTGGRSARDHFRYYCSRECSVADTRKDSVIWYAKCTACKTRIDKPRHVNARERYFCNHACYSLYARTMNPENFSACRHCKAQVFARPSRPKAFCSVRCYDANRTAIRLLNAKK